MSVDESPRSNDGSGIESDPPPLNGTDEVYCTSCGEPIKEQAAVCPNCGVPQGPGGGIGHSASPAIGGGSGSIPPEQAYRLQKLAQKNTGVVGLVGFLLSPAAYWMIGKKGLALVNFITFNYLLLGIILVPMHTWWIIYSARKELDENGVEW